MELYLDAPNACRILAAAPHRAGEVGRVRASLDLNLTEVDVEVSQASFCVRGYREELGPLAAVAAVAAGGDRLFRSVDGGEWQPLQAFAERYAQLVRTAGAPTVEIDGVQMHRTSGTEPFAAAKESATAAVRRGDVVFDACGGLGYTSIHAIRLGAARVITCELSPAVRELRRLNPWSRLEQGLAIELEAGDAFARLARLEPASISSAIHDPPRYSHAPELYSGAFYAHLHQALRPGGRVFHYTGAPYSRRGTRDLAAEVAGRLRQAGFAVAPRDDLQGFVAVKRAGRSGARG